jgi:hypothetical protein
MGQRGRGRNQRGQHHSQRGAPGPARSSRFILPSFGQSRVSARSRCAPPGRCYLRATRPGGARSPWQVARIGGRISSGASQTGRAGVAEHAAGRGKGLTASRSASSYPSVKAGRTSSTTSSSVITEAAHRDAGARPSWAALTTGLPCSAPRAGASANGRPATRPPRAAAQAAPSPQNMAARASLARPAPASAILSQDESQAQVKTPARRRNERCTAPHGRTWQVRALSRHLRGLIRAFPSLARG